MIHSYNYCMRFDKGILLRPMFHILKQLLCYVKLDICNCVLNITLELLTFFNYELPIIELNKYIPKITEN